MGLNINVSAVRAFSSCRSSNLHSHYDCFLFEEKAVADGRTLRTCTQETCMRVWSFGSTFFDFRVSSVFIFKSVWLNIIFPIWYCVMQMRACVFSNMYLLQWMIERKNVFLCTIMDDQQFNLLCLRIKFQIIMSVCGMKKAIWYRHKNCPLFAIYLSIHLSSALLPVLDINAPVSQLLEL